MAASRNSYGYDIASQNYFLDWNLGSKRAQNFAPASRSSVCEARQKLSWKAFDYLLKKAVLPHMSTPAELLWHGNRVVAADGTKLNLPHSEEIIGHFPRRKNGPGLEHSSPALLVSLVDVFTGQPLAAEMTHIKCSEAQLMGSLIEDSVDLPKGKTVFLLDRGLAGGTLWEEMNQRGHFFVSRVKSGKEKSNALVVKSFIASNQREAIVEWTYRNKKKQATQKSSIFIRLLRGRTLKDGSVLLLATNLLDKNQYSRKEILKLYLRRWKVETLYYQVKTLLRLTQFHSKTLNGVLQELYANLLVLSIASLAVLDAQQDSQRARTIAPTNTSQPMNLPNFKNATELVKRNLFCIVGTNISKRKINSKIREMRKQICRIVCQIQPGRSAPRVSHQPVNRWCYAKSHKIKHFKKTGKCPR